jgi:hypothetical protein
LPRDPLVERPAFWTLERGLLTDGAAQIGLMASPAAAAWGRQSFGDLDPAAALRIVLPAGTALIVGLQVVFGTCLLSVLNLRGERDERRRENGP